MGDLHHVGPLFSPSFKPPTPLETVLNKKSPPRVSVPFGFTPSGIGRYGQSLRVFFKDPSGGFQVSISFSHLVKREMGGFLGVGGRGGGSLLRKTPPGMHTSPDRGESGGALPPPITQTGSRRAWGGGRACGWRDYARNCVHST